MNFRVSLKCAAILAGAIMLVMGCEQASQKPSPKPAVLGAVLPLTGDAATFGQNAKRGIELAIEVASEQALGPAGGIVLKAEDSRGTAADATTAARKLIDHDSAMMLVGDVTSAGTHAILPLATKSKIPLVSPSASDPALSGRSPFFCRVWPSDTYEARVIVGHAKAKGYVRSAVVYAETDYGLAMADEFDKQAGSTKSAMRVGVERQTLDFRPVLERLAQSTCDSVFLVMYPEDTVRFLQQAAERKVTLPIMATATFEDPKVAVVPSANGVVFACPAPLADQSPERQDFVSRYKKKFGEDPGVLSDAGYDSAMLLIRAAKAKGVADGQGVVAFIKEQRDYKGASGVMTFDSSGDVVKAYRLKTVKDGKFEWIP